MEATLGIGILTARGEQTEAWIEAMNDTPDSDVRRPRLATARRRHGFTRCPISLRAVLDDQRATTGNRVEIYAALLLPLL